MFEDDHRFPLLASGGRIEPSCLPYGLVLGTSTAQTLFLDPDPADLHFCTSALHPIAAKEHLAQTTGQEMVGNNFDQSPKIIKKPERRIKAVSDKRLTVVSQRITLPSMKRPFHHYHTVHRSIPFIYGPYPDPKLIIRMTCNSTQAAQPGPQTADHPGLGTQDSSSTWKILN